MSYILELEPGVWKARWSGDPGRTLKIENARIYTRWQDAMVGLTWARKYRPFENANIHRVEIAHPFNKREDAE